MLNLDKLSYCDIILTAVIAFLVMHLLKKREGMHLAPTPITLKKNPGKPEDFFSLPYTMGCVPGEGEDASYYSKDLAPGGYCGAQKWVNGMMSNNSITGGIGGSLLN